MSKDTMLEQSKLLALAERVEKLTGPDREVDLDIHLAFEPDGNVARVVARASRGLDGSSRFAWELGRGAVLFEQRDDRGDCYGNGGYPVPAYTTSFDAAMKLVDSPNSFTVGQNVHHKHWVASINYLGDDGEPHSRSNSYSPDSPALALCSAALRAHANSL